MNVYFVLSEELTLYPGSYEPPEPPEYGVIAEIVAASSHGRAKYLALQTEPFPAREVARYGITEMPRFVIRLLGTLDTDRERVLSSDEARPWFERVPNGVSVGPRRRRSEFHPVDVAILGGDPAL